MLKRPRLARVELPDEPTVIYAVGDIHGCFEKLKRLEEQLLEDARAIAGSKLFVMLGDYIDRGPDSAAVLDHLIAPMSEGCFRLCLAGNHEALLIDLLRGAIDLDGWLSYGGAQTLFSYGIDFEYLSGEIGMSSLAIVDELRRTLPTSHLTFLHSLLGAVTTPKYIFAHAGIRPSVPFVHQTDDDFLWIRNEFLDHDDPAPGKIVVHGHTAAHAVVSQGRIAVDTGACFGGRLTAARLIGDEVRIMSVP